MGTSLEVHLTTSELSLQTISTDDSCTAQAEDLVGCYDCMAGAITKVICKSHTSKFLAPLECDEGYKATVTCSPEGATTTLRVPTTTANPNFKCHVTCPLGRVDLTLRGTQLAYVSMVQAPSMTNNVVHSVTEPDDSFWAETWNAIKAKFASFLAVINAIPYALLLIVIIIAIIFILYLVKGGSPAVIVSRLLANKLEKNN